MTAIGDALLFVLSARRTMSRMSFRSAYESLWRPEIQPTGRSLAYAVASAIETLNALGHCEQEAGGDLTVAPPALALLPWPGQPRAVLCGARSPESLTTLRSAARQYQARVTSTMQGSWESPAPARIEASAERVSDLEGIAHATGCTLGDPPPALSMASIGASVGDYLNSLDWTADAELDWPRSDFIPAKLRFDQRDRCDGNLRLSQYRHPDGYSVRDYLWRDGLAAATDRSWGRFAVLADSGIQPLRYDRRSGTVLVPVTTPLPRLLARSLTLSSGLAPREVTDRAGPAMRAYASVPAGLASVVSKKIVAAEPIPVT
jgi:hypothetical protein